MGTMTIEVISLDAREVWTREGHLAHPSCWWNIGRGPFRRHDEALWTRRVDACPPGGEPPADRSVSQG